MTGVGTYIFPAFDILFSPQTPRGWHFYHTVIDGEVVFQPTLENYRDAVKYIRKLWADGLIDIEYFSNSWPEFSGRVRNPETMLVGLASAWTVMDGVGVQYLDDYLRLPPFIGPGRYAGAPEPDRGHQDLPKPVRHDDGQRASGGNDQVRR